MSRPSEQEISTALDMLGAPSVSDPEHRRALRVLRAALAPRPVWPAKEAAACLGVLSANLGDLRGLPRPAQELPRPTVTRPDQTFSLYYVDEIEAFAAERRAKKGGT